MNQNNTFDEIQRATRPAYPHNGSTFIDLSGQRWEFRYGTWCKTTTTAEQRRVRF